MVNFSLFFLCVVHILCTFYVCAFPGKHVWKPEIDISTSFLSHWFVPFSYCTQESLVWQDCLASKPQYGCCLSLQNSTTSCLIFFGIQGLNSSLHSCTTSVFSTKLSPLPFVGFVLLFLSVLLCLLYMNTQLPLSLCMSETKWFPTSQEPGCSLASFFSFAFLLTSCF